MTTLLIDGHNVAIRCLHATARADMVTTTGINTGALHSTILSMANYIKLTKADQVMVCWDSPGGSAKRREIFPEYKANRNEQIEVEEPPERAFLSTISEFLSLVGVQQVALADWEADDLVAAYWNASFDSAVHIASGDKDFYQLLNSGTFIWHPGDKEPWTVERFTEAYGFEPEKMRLVMALTGDHIDGIPGIPKVGLKTAVKILESVEWDLDRLIQSGRFEGCKGVGPREMPPEIITRNLKLVDLTNVVSNGLPTLRPFAPTGPGGHPWAALVQFLEAFELHVIRARLEAGKLWADPGWNPKLARPEETNLDVEGDRLWAF